MPTLKQNKDGSYRIIGKVLKSWCTWQIREPALPLVLKYVRPDELVQPQLFQYLVTRDLLYTHGSGLGPEAPPDPPSGDRDYAKVVIPGLPPLAPRMSVTSLAPTTLIILTPPRLPVPPPPAPPVITPPPVPAKPAAPPVTAPASQKATTCPACGTAIRKQRLAGHLKDRCPKRATATPVGPVAPASAPAIRLLTPCPACGAAVRNERLASHLEERCPKRNRPAPVEPAISPPAPPPPVPLAPPATAPIASGGQPRLAPNPGAEKAARKALLADLLVQIRLAKQDSRAQQESAARGRKGQLPVGALAAAEEQSRVTFRRWSAVVAACGGPLNPAAWDARFQQAYRRALNARSALLTLYFRARAGDRPSAIDADAVSLADRLAWSALRTILEELTAADPQSAPPAPTKSNNGAH